jgi:hypothetical protein
MNIKDRSKDAKYNLVDTVTKKVQSGPSILSKWEVDEKNYAYAINRSSLRLIPDEPENITY